ncbi:MAG: DUF5916 domain-containing protein [Flavobacteriales bacterium]|nr:DUF5916 domain-containing protein [Flavobacteriales bacterium]
MSNFSFGQAKTVKASRAIDKITIDGFASEEQWKTADIATGFLEQNPTEGNEPRFKTEVKVLYDNSNLYILGYCYDSSPDSILAQLGERDDELNSDGFTFSIDTYNKMLDAFTFSVAASGVQSDSRLSDPSFNAVWQSAVQIVSDGWIVEMRIPYYAIRFPNGDKQVWRVQFERNLRRTRTGLQWALVPKEVETELNYWGLLKGLDNIKAPLRLSLSPYTSSFVDVDNGETTLGYGAGADLKLGLNESFTLDMSLLPDFSQVRSDNIVKNLGAFEVEFEEQRPFFQEGVDLFNRGDLFYSRRIGGTPIKNNQNLFNLDSTERVINNPSNTRLINVAKISGRNKKGLGIGVMNAVTASSNALILDDLTGNTREIETNPFVNYNIVSFDQNLKNNSSIYFINLNTTRSGDYIDANVSALGLDLISKSSTYAIGGELKISQRDTNLLNNFFKGGDNDGLSYFVNLAKIKGNFKYSLSSESKSPSFNPNDLGINFTTNIRTHSIEFEYNKYNPFWILNRNFNRFSFDLDQDYSSGKILKKQYSGRYIFDLKSFNTIFINMSAQVGDGIDLFESRVTGQEFIIPEYYYNGIGISSDYRKRFALDGNIGFGKGYFTDYIVNQYFELNVSPIIRFTDKFTLTPSSNYSVLYNGAGFAGYFEGLPKYGVRDVRTLVNIMKGKYVFKNNLSLTLRIRHYWSYGEYDYYGDLDENGYIIRDDAFQGDSDFNFNAFNTDLIFAWQFAPGGFINLVYKNAFQTDDSNTQLTYFNNLGAVLDAGQRNTVTMKLVYFFDTVSSYNKLFKQKSS